MPIQIVSGNLNVIGNNGQFETDRSTWGFSDSSHIEATRSTDQAVGGLYSCKVRAKSTQGLSENVGSTMSISGKSTVEFGKKYFVKVQVYVSTEAPIAPDTAIISLKEFISLPASGITFVDKTVLEAKGNWVQIEGYFEHSNNIFVNPGDQIFRVGLIESENGSEALIQNGLLYIDNFEIYEYIEVDEPEPCDINLDNDSTIVTDETGVGNNDGSINVAVTGVGPFEYSKDGAAWQAASLFTGLGTSIYVVRVRNQGNEECTDEYPFAINHGAILFDFSVVVTNESVGGAGDGAIVVSVDGTGGPFEFSVDAGQNWQSSNNFVDLAPAIYYVAVRDANQNSVVKVGVIYAGSSFIDNVFHSKNPITFLKTASAGYDLITNYRLYSEVRVEDVADSGNYNVKLKMELPPDTNGQAFFYLRAAFRGVFSFVPPTHNEESIIRLTDRIKRFKNYSGELSGAATVPDVLTESLIDLVLFGGIDRLKWPELDYFSEYLPNYKKFLTWAPLTKYVDRNQEDYLNFWVYGNFTTLKIQVKAFFDDGTDQTAVTKTKEGSKYTELYQLPAGPSNCGVMQIDPAKNVTKYDLTVLDQSDVEISETRTYLISLVRHPLTRFFMFLNSLGAYEVLRFTGQAQEKANIEKEYIQRFLAHNYQALDGQYEVNNAVMTQENNYSSGYVKGLFAKEWHEYLKDFLLSGKVFDVTDGRRVPIIVTGDHTQADQDYERYIRFSAKTAYDNESFTPGEI